MKAKKDYTLEELIKVIVAFRDERDWKQFHNPKDSAMALNLEAGEVLEHFLWKKPSEVREHVKNKKTEIADELSDVLFWVLLMSHDLDIDLGKSFYEKLEQNEKKYPAEKVRGKHKKYTEY